MGENFAHSSCGSFEQYSCSKDILRPEVIDAPVEATL